jgi:hypothetical protein
VGDVSADSKGVSSKGVTGTTGAAGGVSADRTGAADIKCGNHGRADFTTTCDAS